MINPFNPKDQALDEAIASVYSDLAGFTAETDEYQKAMNQLTALYALREKRVDPNVVLTTLGNIGIALAVIKYEQTGIVTSKVFQFLGKMR